MSDEPSFVKCPYCQRKLEKKPTRKSKCPHCGESHLRAQRRLDAERQTARK